MRLWVDSEDYSEVPITHGTYKYAKNCEILLITFAVDDGPVSCLDLTAGDSPQGFIDLAKEATEIWAHNSGFDRVVFREQLGLNLPMKRWRDTMVQAFCHSLPGGLGKLSGMFGLGADKAKDADGQKLIHLFCKPLGKNRKLDRATRHTHPEEWKRFKGYAISDIKAMREVHKKMPKWNYPNNPRILRQWHIDQLINDKGFLIDKDLAQSIVVMLDREKKRLSKKTSDATGGQVRSTTQRDALLDYIFAEHGVHLDGLKKSQVLTALDKFEMPAEVRELLLTRLQASKASTSKYTAVLNGITEDNVLRGAFQFAGASRTMRYAGRRLQVQNLPSRGLLPGKVTDAAIPQVKAGIADLIHDNPMHLASSLIRKMIMARPGKKFLISDWANIEGRLAAWCAGEEWKLKAFADFDQGIGHDLYNLSYADAFDADVTQVSKAQRAIGKVLELFLGYEGGVGAFMVGAATYGFDMEVLANDVYDILPIAERDESTDYLAWVKKQKRSTYGISDKAFITADTLKRKWRNKHPEIVSYWRRLRDAAMLAIVTGQVSEVGKVKVMKRGGWLLIQLPSGRYLTYPQARVVDGKIIYSGKNQYTGKWQDLSTFGGKILENICQGIGADLLNNALENGHDMGLDILLHVHDEVLAEVNVDIEKEVLTKLMLNAPDWAAGLPIAAESEQTFRYQKG